MIYEAVLDVDATGHAEPRFAAAAIHALVDAPDEAAAMQLLASDLAAAGYRILPANRRATAIADAEWPRYMQDRWPARVSEFGEIDEFRARLGTTPVVHLSFYPHE
jgi:hypothetical protein